MGRYVIKRLLHGLFSTVMVIFIVMILVYGLMDRMKIFKTDGQFTKQLNNQRVTYMHQKWEEYGYLDYLPYSDYLAMLQESGEIDEAARSALSSIGRSADGSDDSPEVAEYVAKFNDYCREEGYTVTRLDAIISKNRLATGGGQVLFAYKEKNVLSRLWKYFTGIFEIDNIHKVPEDQDIGERGLTFTFYDPVYGGEKFSPAIIGNGTIHRYLLYFDDQFPYIHQNFLNLHLGASYSVTRGVEVFNSMTQGQGSYRQFPLTYPTGLTENSADNLHTAVYVAGSREANVMYQQRYTDDYTNVQTFRNNKSRMGYSFVIGIISTLLVYLLGLPIGVLMARYKEGLLDKFGTLYIMFISAVPSLAYIFIFKGIGRAMGLPWTFDMDAETRLMYVLPIVSLALPSIAGMMKWMRRYMIDQMNSDYVKFARAGGMSETEIFFKHVMKVAAIPIFQGIPGSLLFAMTGALITERVYLVPGAGGLLIDAINQYDNSVIVGVTLFYTVLSVLSLILGDVVMATVDPRISFTEKAR